MVRQSQRDRGRTRPDIPSRGASEEPAEEGRREGGRRGRRAASEGRGAGLPEQDRSRSTLDP
eukprot:7054597-Alexandrium_andersonii.AAC.1